MSWLDLEENDFIIPDEAGRERANKRDTSFPDAHNLKPQATETPSSFPWAPTVDLLTAFTPFFTPANGQDPPRVLERRFAGGDTLDEPVLDTLKRDMARIGRRVAAVVWPVQLQKRLAAAAAPSGFLTGINSEDVSDHVTTQLDTDAGSTLSADWDLWGPLVFLLAYAVTLGVALPAAQTNAVFSGTFLFMWIFFLVVGFNVQLLGGTASFLAAISAIGYSLFPIVVGALVSTVAVSWRMIRLVIMALCALWSIYAASVCLRCLGVRPGRLLLAIYPVTLMYTVLAWLAVIT